MHPFSQAALAGLTQAAEGGLPFPALFPHRRAVAAGLKEALDDSKKAVRAAAVRCKRAWAAGVGAGC